MEAHTVRTKKQVYVQIGIFLQALIATMGSLYYSTFGDIVKNINSGEIFPANSGFLPCELCWFARIMMYPIVILSLVGLIKKDNRFTDYVLALSLPGILLEIYHYTIQKAPIENIFDCSLTNPCSASYVNYFGFITIPFLCGVAFIVITTLALINTHMERKKRIMKISV